MIKRKIPYIICTVLGCFTAAAAILAVVWGIHAQTVILREPQGAIFCAEHFLSAINNGNLSDAADCFLDSTLLGEAPADPDGTVCLIWDTYRTKMSAKAVTGLYSTSNGLAMDVEITVLNISESIDKVGNLAIERMQENVNTALDMAELYDASGQYRSDLVDTILQQAAIDTMMGDLPAKVTRATVHFVQSSNIWKIIPDGLLIDALSGKE